MEALSDLIIRVSRLESRLANTVRHGTVKEVDPAKQRVRLTFGIDPDGDDAVGAWVPYGQMAGALKVHTPPSVGQTMTLFSPSGDMQQGVAMPFTWSEQNASPSDKGDENVITYGDVRITLNAGSLVIQVGGVTHTISAQGVDTKGGEITHDGKHIDASHVHGGIIPGGSDTDVPSN